ncbi:hypothetical protein [Sporichthya sp.]|uniref:hypothetical protein n=1 Tax=Sporichthya sp. TaxID=65475 RepID=UPI0017F01611|nr:hypothetical protein [Sporichthya sp.]MBA3742493.1 hypothetical protein [Sporichthya sp.]
MTQKLSWPPIIERAANIVLSYEISVTLRQLFYRLVSEELIPNSQTTYKALSARTAALRRHNEFPPLYDRGRKVLQAPHWASADAGVVQFVEDYFRLDRTLGQDKSTFEAVLAEEDDQRAQMRVQLTGGEVR